MSLCESFNIDTKNLNLRANTFETSVIFLYYANTKLFMEDL